MYLSISKNNNVVYLYKAKKVRIAKGKYKEVKEPLGKLEDLKKEFPDPIAHFKSIIANENKNEKELKKSFSTTINIDMSTVNLNDYADELVLDEDIIKNLGSIFIQKIYHTLGLEELMLDIKRKLKLNLVSFKKKKKELAKLEKNNSSLTHIDILKEEIKNDKSLKLNTNIPLSKVFQLLLISRAIFPNSKLSDFKRKNNFADVFNVSLDDIYTSLDIFHEYQDDIIKTVNKNMHKLIKYNFINTHYDLTNFFIYTSRDSILIKKGYSKINNNLPIIQMALLADANGLPVSYKLFPGNRNDVSSLIDFLKQQQNNFPIKQSTIVADAGLLSNDNIIAIVSSGNHYVIKARMLQLNKEIYSTFTEIVKPQMMKIMEKNKNLKGCYFPINIKTTLKVKTVNNTIENVDVLQKYIFMYSTNYDERSKKIRLEELENAEKYIKNPNKLKDKFKFTASGLLKVDSKNAEVQLNKKKLDKYEQTSGFSLLVTDLVDTDDKEIINKYKNQYLIEQSFRYAKTNLDIDNVYLQKENRIEAHFLTGFLALTFLKVIQLRLKKELTIEQIQETLKGLNLTKVRNNNIYLLSKISKEISKISLAMGIELNKGYDGNTLRKLIGNVKKH